MANKIDLDADSLARFKRRGFIKLKQVISQEEIAELHRWCDEPIWTPDDPRGLPGFANTTYRTGTQQTIFERLAEDENLRATLRQLAGERLIYTNGNRFRLNPGEGGSPWHFGRITFSYIQPLELGYSLWVPLHPIDVQDQHGGMVWVPEDVWSARGRFQMWANYLRIVKQSAKREALDAALREQFGTPRGFPMLGPYDHAFLELAAETDNFEVGDALLFSKYVWHRTEPLRAGKMPQRIALVLRYVSENATFAKDLMVAATGGMNNQERQADGVFGSYLEDIDQGALLRSSAFCPPPR